MKHHETLRLFCPTRVLIVSACRVLVLDIERADRALDSDKID